jgi:hypothetical protein
MAHNDRPVDPVLVPPAFGNGPGGPGFPGAPLDDDAVQAALKTNKLIGDILTYIAVACAALSAAFFFASIFVSSSFMAPYAISMVATFAFGWAGDCVSPKRGRGVPAPGGPGAFAPPPPPPAGAKNRGFFGMFQAPPLPDFVPGQPVHITNDGSSCFVDSAFWMLMSWPQMKQALVESFQEWNTKFAAMNKFIVWLKSPNEAEKPTAEDIPLLVALFSEDVGGDFYNFIGKQVELPKAPEALTTLFEWMKAFRRARFDGEEDPEIPEADIETIMGLFNGRSPWSSKQIDLFIAFMNWVEAPQRRYPPKAADVEKLVSVLSQQQCQQFYLEKIKALTEGDKAAKAPKLLTEFVAQVDAAKESLALADEEPAEAPLCVDFFFAVSAAGMARDLSDQLAGIQGFLTAVEKYDKTQGDSTHRTEMRLTALRNFLPRAIRQGQQDSADMFRYLSNWIDVRKHPGLFFNLSMEQEFVPYDAAQELDQVRAQKEVERLAKVAVSERAPDILPFGSRKVQKPVLNYELCAPIPVDRSSWGQDLFDGLFKFHEGMGHDPIIYADPDTNEAALYKISRERFAVDKLPDTFIFTLKRFVRTLDGRSLKNPQAVVMPEYLTHEDEIFEVTGVIFHGGSFNGGHYVELSKVNGEWWMCDDSGPHWNSRYVYKASPAQVKSAFTYGYQYLVRKCEDDFDIETAPKTIADWPPKDLPQALALPPPPKPKAPPVKKKEDKPAVVDAPKPKDQQEQQGSVAGAKDKQQEFGTGDAPSLTGDTAV